ncbi:MAG TPA: tetratricopeptide repeat protein, partial [Spirochaetota bacterium]|nr:tetratricopeptide repeat protein [Spirochaetota bacterium]
MNLLEQFKEALKLEQEGKFQEALTVYTSIITVDNSFRAALLNLGSLYYRMKRYNEALDSFMGALKL